MLQVYVGSKPIRHVHGKTKSISLCFRYCLSLKMSLSSRLLEMGRVN